MNRDIIPKLTPQQRSEMRKIIGQTGKTIHNHSLIQGGDTVAVGISGGKDSVTLLDILSRRKKHLPVSYKLKPVFIRVTGIHDSFNSTPLEAWCNKTAGSYTEITISCDMTTGKDPCFICSWHRRKALFDYCKNEKITTVALGHTGNDRAETLLMNLFYQGSISSMPLSLRLFEGRLHLVRPLGEILEKDILRYIQLRNLSYDKSPCRYFTNQRRKTARGILESLQESNASVLPNIIGAMENIKVNYL